MDPEVTKEQPRLKRFCIVRLEERIAPAAGGNEGKSILVTIFTR